MGVVAGGWMVALGLGLPVMFAFIGIPALVACAALFAMNRGTRARKPGGTSSQAGAR